jgi:23S rRNA (adenine2030-N6)-methyltransferase
MLSYQHEYHAGNHADVLKHVTLTLALQALQRKDSPLRALDGWAGSGLYDLTGREARFNAEHETGIGRLLAAKSTPPALESYLRLVRASNRGERLRYYPGSPRIARGLLRPADHLVLMELHPRAVGALRRNFAADRQVHIHRRDAFEGVPALLPPPERRGLVLVDPSYELKEDFQRVVTVLQASHRRWPRGCYLIWYPLIRDRAAERFAGSVAATTIRRILRIELQVQSNLFTGMRGSGLLIVNPPFGLEKQLRALLPWLWETLAVDGRGGFAAAWLVPE